MKSAAAFWSFPSLLLLSIACSSDPKAPATPPPPTPGTNADVETALAARAKSFCKRVFDCCDGESKTALLQTFNNAEGSPEACETAVKDSLKTTTQLVLTAMQKKDAEFFPAKETTCLKDDDAKSCSDFFKYGRQTEPKIACATAFTGKLKVDDPCSVNAACESGYCKLSGETGVCAATPAEGDACDSAADCGGIGDLYCHRTAAPPKCAFIAGTCKPRESKEDGAECCAPEECLNQTCSLTQKGPKCNDENRLKCDQ